MKREFSEEKSDSELVEASDVQGGAAEASATMEELGHSIEISPSLGGDLALCDPASIHGARY